MTRAAFLPTPTDPFLIHYWLGFFKNVWYDEVDRLYVYVNGSATDEVRDYILDILKDPKITFIYNPVQTDHGIALKHLLDICTEDLVVLMEDDGYVWRKGQVDYCFKRIEGGEFDIVGSKRGSCAAEIYDRAQEFFGLRKEYGEGDHGPNFWPNFLFLRTRLLMATDGVFTAKAWHKGDIIKELGDYVVQDDVAYGDTFVWASMQLRSFVPDSRIFYVTQYHGHPDDYQHFQENRFLFDGLSGWVHVGSLSSGVYGILRDNNNRALAHAHIKPPEEKTVLPPEWCKTDMERGEWERRIVFWSLFLEQAEPDRIIEFKRKYELAILQVIEQYGLSPSRIRRKMNMYKTLGL